MQTLLQHIHISSMKHSRAFLLDYFSNRLPAAKEKRWSGGGNEKAGSSRKGLLVVNEGCMP